MEENKKPKVALTDEERFPILENLDYLRKLRQDLQGPKFNFKSGDRLTQQHLNDVKKYKKNISEREKIDDSIPSWLQDYTEKCVDKVPFYKDRKKEFIRQPTVSKKAIVDRVWDLVSDDANLDELLVYQTSGTTGKPMDVNFSPVAQASYLPQLESILDEFNIQFSNNPRKIAIALICNQISTLTYASLSSYLNGAGIIKINLNPTEWNKPEDRVSYLEKHNPEILTGDPFSFASLKKLQPKISPKALVSSSSTLHPSLKKELQEYFNCPIIDIYSLTESRMIAYKVKEGYKTIRPDIYLEVFQPNNDELLKEGEFGELVISGGNNPFFNLIRYRTSDFCRLKTIDGVQYIYDLEARKPVIFYDEKKQLVNSIDISRSLIDFNLSAYQIHQNQDSSINIKIYGEVSIEKEIKQSITKLFGKKIIIFFETLSNDNLDKERKPVKFSSAFQNN